MAYYDIAQLGRDTQFLDRVAACYAVESAGKDDAVDPPLWATQRSWVVAAQPGFGDAYAYALANGNEAPGKDAAVITDAQLLAAVQSLLS